MEFIIAKNYWNEMNQDGTEVKVINVLKFDKMEWGYLHGENEIPLIPKFDLIDTIYFETEAEREKEWNLMKVDGYTSVNDFQPPAYTHDHASSLREAVAGKGN